MCIYIQMYIHIYVYTYIYIYIYIYIYTCISCKCRYHNQLVAGGTILWPKLARARAMAVAICSCRTHSAVTDRWCSVNACAAYPSRRREGHCNVASFAPKSPKMKLKSRIGKIVHSICFSYWENRFVSMFYTLHYLYSIFN